MSQFLLYSNLGLWIVTLFILGAIFLIFRQFGEVFLKSGDAISRDGIPIGDKIHHFEQPAYELGKSVSTQDLLGRPTLLAFTSTTCKPCRELFPDWNKAIAQYGTHVNFVMVGLGERDQWEELLAKIPIQGELLIDTRQILLTDCKVRVTPFGIMLDEKGVVTGKGLLNSAEHIQGLMSSVKNQFIQVEHPAKQQLIQLQEERANA
ncbi:methylamine dehydrogenase accessory protein MauD [Tumebacillus sp. BK434]|uniref:redoxin domain-containing protein n=1 Tax=Tumebacillus sp. BK434 TaxID=2512169 RepID=UPI0010E8E9C5|nr:redoxin domain-containing protein [Tumebacillus sp. BK434]TCP52385.1 methylamine dehydrogenase accessory protein MauD [Tumebacillus sp. BK434]